MCELNSEVKMFCTTTSNPIQATRPSPRNSSRCTSHIAYNRMTPTMPHCTATFSVWLCGLPMTWPVALIGVAGRGPLEQPAHRARPVADDRRLGK